MTTKSVPAATAKSAPVATVPLSQMVTELAEKTDMPKTAVAGLFDEFVQLTTKHLKKGNKVRITGLGILQVRKRAAIKLKASKKVAFKRAKIQVSKNVALELEASASSRSLRVDPLIKRVAALVGSEDRATAWFNYQPIPAFGGKTARELVADDRRDAVSLHLDTLENGVFA